MAKANTKTKLKLKGNDQPQLIDVEPKRSKEILAVARAYTAAQAERTTALAEEKKQKAKLLALVKDEDLHPVDADGVIRFIVDGVLITITPRDELVQIKEADGAEEGD